MPQIEITPQDKFIVTGVKYQSNKRFKLVYSNIKFALSINIWRGSVWLLRNGKRVLLKRVQN